MFTKPVKGTQHCAHYTEAIYVYREVSRARLENGFENLDL